jgi:hypothetical protein
VVRRKAPISLHTILCRSSVERENDAQGGAVDDVGVDHRGSHVAVREQCLDGANVRASFQQVRGEVMLPLSIPLGCAIRPQRANQREGVVIRRRANYQGRRASPSLAEAGLGYTPTDSVVL